PGAGAGGGLGGGLLGFLGGGFGAGAALVLGAVGFAKRIVGADLVITGEGRIDRQSGFGKLTGAVVDAAHRANVPVAAVAGSLGRGHEVLTLERIEVASDGVPAARRMADPLPL